MRLQDVSLSSLSDSGIGAATEFVDRRLMVKLSLASSSGRLDLTDWRLTQLPPEIFDIEGLEELSLAGNCLTSLPSEIGRLTSLKRLQLAGNLLTTIPSSIRNLTNLEGLWLGGNLLEILPEEVGALTSLKQLILSGNCLRKLPSSLGALAQLVELEVAGNILEEVPPELYRLASLRKLSLNGNKLKALPEDGVKGLESLKELWLMGNSLSVLPEGLCDLKALEQLNVCDNIMASLPAGLARLQKLQKLWAYGNQLKTCESIRCLWDNNQGLEVGSLWQCLDSVWLEGNPFDSQASSWLLGTLANVKGWMPSLKSLGLDLKQLRGVGPELIRASSSVLKAGEVIGVEGTGYFKLSPSPITMSQLPHRFESHPDTTEAAQAVGTLYASVQGSTFSTDLTVPDSAAGSGQKSLVDKAALAGEWMAKAVASGKIIQAPVLLVSFGSAPGLPNWGGLIGRIYKQAKSAEDGAFDVLYVVDPGRSWYQEVPDSTIQYYADRLRQYTERYKQVIMVGDSMGATAALAFSRMATRVLAFCPQVDLTLASIRPGQNSQQLQAFREYVLQAVCETSAKVTVYCGTWQHDLDQANLLPADKVHIKVHSLDSHRLALYLDQSGKLLPIVHEAIIQQQHLNNNQQQRLQNGGMVRVSNLL